jgi:hypothetical protein
VNAALRAEGRSSLWLREHGGEVEADIGERLVAPFNRLASVFTGQWLRLGTPGKAPLEVRLLNARVSSLSLPWARTFEARLEIDLEAEVRDLLPGRPACEAVAR